MLDFAEFTEEFITGCRNVLKEDTGAYTKIEKAAVSKPQRGVLTGLRFVREGSRIAPTLYAEDMFARYAQGCPVDRIAREAVESIRQSFDIRLPFPEEEFDLSLMMGDIRPRLLSKDRNPEIAGNVPHMDAGEGLMLIADVVRGDYRAIITNDMIKDSGLTEDEIFDAALINVSADEAVLFGLSDMVYKPPGERTELFSSGDGVDAIGDYDVFILSNKDMFWGAAAIFYPGIQDRLRGMIGDFYVIPSSVHELLLLPVTADADPDNLAEMIWSANRSVVDEEEVLSDDLYLCDPGSRKLVPYRASAAKETYAEA